MNGKVAIDWGKTLQIVILVAATVYLGSAGVIASEVVSGVIFGLAGYIFGNGKSVVEGHPPAPLIRRRPASEDRDPEV